MNHRARIPALLLALALLLGCAGCGGGREPVTVTIWREQRRPDLSQPAGQRDARAGRDDPDELLPECEEVINQMNSPSDPNGSEGLCIYIHSTARTGMRISVTNFSGSLVRP